MRRLCLLIHGLLILGIATVQGQEDPNAVLAELEQSFSKITTVQTDFIQVKVLKVFKHPVTIKGRILLQAPDRLLWRVNEPIPYAFLLQGKRATEWDQETGKIRELPFTGNPVFEQILVQIKSWFSGEFSELRKSYDVDVLSQTPLVLRFIPKSDNQAGKVIKEMRVRIREDHRYIESIVIAEVNGDVTTTQFKEVVLNQTIPAEAWRVTPE